MKTKKLILLSILITCFYGLTFGQTKEEKKTYHRIGLIFLNQLGNVYVDGTKQLFYSALYLNSPQDQAAQTNHLGNHLGLSFVAGKFLSPSVQLGIGLNTEFYLNIGDKTMYALPVYAQLKYNVPVSKNAFYSEIELGYSPFTAGNIHNGVKAGAALGYEIISRSSGRRYSIGVGYNYQILSGVEQNVFTTTKNGNSRINRIQSVNKLRLAVHTLPVTLKYSF